MRRTSPGQQRPLEAFPSAVRGVATALLPLLLLATPVRAQKLKVVATIPDLADIASAIGGDRVETRSLSRGTENLHAVPVKPSMLVAMSRADLFLEMGLSLESTWVPELLRSSRNRAIQPGSSGFVNCSVGWQPIEVPDSLSREGGDLHPEGNPHFNLHPQAGRHLAERILEGLIAVDAEGEGDSRRRYAAYLEQLAAGEERWRELGAELRGRKVAVYHVEYNYLAAHFGMDVAVSVEPKPGIPPTPRDVARVVAVMRDQRVPVILTAAWSNNRQVADIARKSGAEVVELPNQVGGAPWAETWIELMDGVLERLLAAQHQEGTS